MNNNSLISNKSLVIRIVLLLLISSMIVLIISLTYLKKAAVDTLAQDDAKKTAQLVFETMNTRMQEGWGKEDLIRILDKLEIIREGMTLNSYRSSKVEEILGVNESDKQVVLNDKEIQKAMDGKERFIVSENGSIRFLYPMKVKDECITCHYNTKAGDVNGVLEVKFEQSSIKISLESMITYFIAFFLIFMLLFFYVFYNVINIKMVRPVVELTDEITQVAKSKDLSLRADIHTNISELKTLQNSFNGLLETIKYYYDKLINSLYIDNLTGLYNMLKLQKDIDNKNKFTLILLNIDSFKELNHFYGVKVCDYILVEFAKFLKMIADNDAKVYRLYGDEFVLVFNDELREKYIRELLKRIHEYKFIYKESEISIYVSMGYVVSDTDRTIEKATIAMRNAKNNRKFIGKFDSSIMLQEEYSNHITWTRKVEDALNEGRIIPYFQPIKNGHTGQIEKYESLARLIEDDTIYTPDKFIEVSQRAKFYPKITQSVINKIFEYFKDKDDVSFSINLSLEDIINEETKALLFTKLKEYNYGQRVVVELLETEEISDFDLLNAFIKEVKKYGAKVAIDDFGAGYSNYNYILNLDIDFIKLDSSLIENIDNDIEAMKVVSGIVVTARDLNLKVIAEKVHSQNIEDLLTMIGVDYLQGYHIGKPQKDILY